MTSVVRRARSDGFALGALWLLVAIYHARLFLPRGLRTYVVEGDFSRQFFPYRHFAASEWWQGRIPLWNPYVFAGHPFFADVQTAVFYPPTWLTVLISPSGLRYTVLEAEMAFHYLLAATFAYLLGRTLFQRRFAAFVVALVFTFSGFLTSYPAQQLPMLETAVWLPLAVLSVARGARRPERALAWASLGGAAIGVAFLAGHPQATMFAAYTSGAFLLYRYGRAYGLPLALAGLVVFGLAAAGLAAVSLVPAYEFLGLSNRASMDYATAGVGYEVTSLIGIVFPLWRSEKALSVGIIALLLGVLALRWDSRGPVRFWAGVWLFGVVLSVGARTPLFWVLYHYVPGFNLFRDQERAMYVSTLAAAILAGYGWCALEAAMANSSQTLMRLRRYTALLALLTIVAVGVAAVRWLAIGTPATGGTRALLLAIPPTLLVVVLIAIVARFGKWLWQRPVPLYVVLALLVVLDLWIVNYGNNQSEQNPDPRPRFYDSTAAIRAAIDEPFRIRPAHDDVFPPNYAGPLDLPTINGDTPFALARNTEMLYHTNADYRLWQLLNVKFVLLPRDRPPVDGLEKLLEQPDHVVYRMVYSLPRAWAVRAAQVATSVDDARDRALAPGFHPGDAVILEETPAGPPVQPGERPDVQITHLSPQRVEIATFADGPSFLVLADTYYPGWKARIDDEETHIYRANYLTRAILLPAGRHHVVFTFEPMSLRLGAAITLVTLLALIGIALRIVSRQRSPVSA